MQRQRIVQIAQFVRPTAVRLDLPHRKSAISVFDGPHRQIRLCRPCARIRYAQFFLALHIVSAEYAVDGKRRPAPLAFAIRTVGGKPEFRLAERFRLGHHQFAVRAYVFQSKRLRADIFDFVPRSESARSLRHEKERSQFGKIAPLRDGEKRAALPLFDRMRNVTETAAFGTLQMPCPHMPARHPSPDLNFADLCKGLRPFCIRTDKILPRLSYDPVLCYFKIEFNVFIFKIQFHILAAPRFLISFIPHFLRRINMVKEIKITIGIINRSNSEQRCIDK